MKLFLKKIFSILILYIIICEAFIRVFAIKDNDNNYFLGYSPLLPAKLPINESKIKIKKYNEMEGQLSFTYDSIVGWLPKNVVKNKNLRKPAIGGQENENKENILKIVILGDSYALSAPLIDSLSWVKKIEKDLKTYDMKTEIFNFGAGGYGLDQSYIRWLKEGKYYFPDIVIVGITEGLIKSNLNLIRPLKTIRTGIPFSKPRFIINNAGKLSLINSPTIPKNDIVSTLSDLENWKWVDYEYFFSNEKYSDNILYNFKTLTFLNKVLDKKKYRKKEMEFFSLNNEASQITIKIMEKIKFDLEELNGELFIIHFPTRNSLKSLNNGLKLLYNDLFVKLANNYKVIDPTEKLLELINRQGLDAVAKDHYTELGYNAVGSMATKSIIENLGKISNDK